MQDAVLFYSVYSAEKSTIIKGMGLEGMDFALCTIHRPENTDDPVRLASIVGALNEISRKMSVVLPLHPRTRKIIASCSVPFAFEPIYPVGYFDMIELIKHTKVVLTDSGGLQKEAFFFDKPCVTLRDETEWVELLSSRANRLAGADRELIVKYSNESITDPIVFNKDLYGNGRASENIVKYIQRDYSNIFIATVK